MHTAKKKVFVGMSGGVDSSVAAFLLKKRGYDVTGIFMRSFNIDGCQDRDAEDARRVAEHLGIPFYVWDFEDAYKKKVVEYMVNGYRRGETPNPDVMCNREIKFGLFLARARRLGADYVATGHYVRLRRSDLNIDTSELSESKKDSFGLNSYYSGRYVLCQAKDKNKDQSYFLWTLTQKELAHCLFPIGEYLKPEVRAIARRAGLPTADKKDSQGICFLGQVTLAEFLKTYIPEKHGVVINAEGEKIGEHNGAHFYTIGQRHGLHLGMKNRARGITGAHNTDAHYVAAKDVKKNIVTVAEGSNNPALFRKELELRDVNFIDPNHSLIRTNKRIEVLARVRYRQPLMPATLTLKNKGISKKGTKKNPRQSASVLRGVAILVFVHPQKFVAAGQSTVFYSEAGEMLGGGVIC